MTSIVDVVASKQVSGTFTAGAQTSDEFLVEEYATVTLSGTFVASVVIENKDHAGNWVPAHTEEFTLPTIQVVDVPSRAKSLTTWRLRCSAYTSGTVIYGVRP